MVKWLYSFLGSAEFKLNSSSLFPPSLIYKLGCAGQRRGPKKLRLGLHTANRQPAKMEHAEDGKLESTGGATTANKTSNRVQ